MAAHRRHTAIGQCEGKQRFESAQLAWEIATRRKNFRTRKKEEQVRRPYRCPHCGFWHLGRQ